MKPSAPASSRKRVVGNKGRAHKDGGCETYKSTTQHLVFSFQDGEQLKTN
jgi:hypothetical protein